MPTNILLITSDQQHYMAMGRRNPKVQTPNLDRLAKMGTTFRRAYCPNPTCTPTRSSLITGQWPSCHGAYTLGTMLPESAATVGDELAAAGYRTSLIGKAHFQPLKRTDEAPSVETIAHNRDLSFWKSFNDEMTPWYGFDHVEQCRNHADEGHAGGHYGLWMESKGLKDWRAYFQIRSDGVIDTDDDATKAPPIEGGPGYGWRKDMHWRLPAEYHYTTFTAQRTNAEIEHCVKENVPFFCWSSYHDPHPPYVVPEPWASMYDPADMDDDVGAFIAGEFDDMPPPHQMTRDPQADFSGFNEDGFGNHGYHPHWIEGVNLSRQNLREALAIYYGMVSFMDHAIGTTLDTLERLGQLDNTLIVFTSDHGHFLGQHGLVAKGPFHYEDVIRVPMIASWPGHIPADQDSDALQTLVDFAPTFLDAAQLDTPRWMQGRSQLPDWTAADASCRRSGVIVENHHNGAAVHLRTLVTDRHKLTIYRGRPEWGELFDLEADPNELQNLYDSPDAAAVRSSMIEQLAHADLEREPAPTARINGA